MKIPLVSSVRRVAAASAGAVLLCAALPANAQITLADSNGWKVNMMGLLSVWTGSSSWDVRDDIRFGGDLSQDSFRVTTGFNPSKLEFVVVAPEVNGITVSSYTQFASSLQGFKTRRVGEQIEVRAMDISVAGKFGNFQFGRSFAIYAGNSILADTGSMRGTGYICTGPDGSGPNCGHIGTGYTWTDWTAGIRYSTPRSASGFQFRVGLFDPIETAFGIPGGDPFVVGTSGFDGQLPNGLLFNFSEVIGTTNIETSTPLIEAELSWNKAFGPGGANNILLWLNAMNQNLEDLGTGSDTDIQGLSFGGRLKVGRVGITANVEDTEGIAEGFMGFGVTCLQDEVTLANNQCASVEGSQWYVNLDITAPSGKTVFGVSYGEGEEDANPLTLGFPLGNVSGGSGDVERDLLMVYIQHNVTPNLNVNAEFHTFERTTVGGNLNLASGLFPSQEEYSAFLLGGEFRF